MHFHIITIFPGACQGYTDTGVIGRAQKNQTNKHGKKKTPSITISFYNPRDFTDNKHNKIDDTPYGGGPGMVMQAEPILKAWQQAVGKKRNKSKVKTIITSPRGSQFTNKIAKKVAKKYAHVVIICGRYEGIDSRVQEILQAEEVSIGEFVLTGGEIPALTIIDAVARQVPGVLGEESSLEENREAPRYMYTKPSELKFKNKKYSVPEVFLSGDPKKIAKWHKNAGLK